MKEKVEVYDNMHYMQKSDIEYYNDGTIVGEIKVYKKSLSVYHILTITMKHIKSIDAYEFIEMINKISVKASEDYYYESDKRFVIATIPGLEIVVGANTTMEDFWDGLYFAMQLL